MRVDLSVNNNQFFLLLMFVDGERSTIVGGFYDLFDN